MSLKGRLNEGDFTRIVREVETRQRKREAQAGTILNTGQIAFGGGGGINNPNEGSENIDATSIRRRQLIVPNNSSANATLGTTTTTGHAELFYQFKRGSLRGAGRLRAWHDGATVNVEHIDMSGDLPGENTATGSMGWTGSISAGNMLLTWASDNSGNSTTFNLAYITTEVL